MTVRFPWPTLETDLQLVIDEVLVDGVPLDPSLVDGERQRVALDDTSAWRELRMAVSIDPEALSSVAGAAAHAVVECTPTNVRIPFPLDTVTGAGQITLDRDEIAERFSVRVEAVATVEGRLRHVGAGPDWTAVIDRVAAPVPPGMPPFETVWIDFRDPTAPLGARSMPESPTYMDLQGDPRLLLNAAVDGFQHLLHANTAQLERRRLRDLLGADVARYAVTCLFRAAAVEVSVDDGVVQPPERPVYRQVCQAVADRMPGIGDVEELYEKLHAARDSALVAQEVWGAADLAIAALSGRDDALVTACREVKHA
ncbi:hypothetical protein [Pseudonocardia alni]|uniref:hypothetical protein n=1 Tax=Pseudonocardia alni TaxID=33907 RepID=UPI0033DC9BE5